MTIYGIDFAWGRPGPAAIKAARLNGERVEFVCRYLSHDTTGKNLTKAEAQLLSDNGLWLVVVWESTANRALAGHAAGVDDAHAALAQAQACGMPDDRPIYFAVDWDASSAQQATINAYLDGAASVLGRARVGLYGGYYPIKRAFDAGKITFGWQTYAWSGGHWDPRAQIQQYSNGHRLNGVGIDYDRATTSDYGQWRVGASPAPQEDDMDPNTKVTIPDYWLDPARSQFSHSSYSAAFLWAAAVAEIRATKGMVAAQGAAIGELTKTVATLAANSADIDPDALVAKIEDAISKVVIHLDPGTEPATA